ncbi:N-acetylmuramoyl-L-alanine amidase [Aquibacillus albus]|uniref:N-acetylmuramoyl-L-alanine amidase n=1 Tax=Aquibacillus albus TaxID=1168171 RepID=A0ABS2MY01_9BACI|nr:N-acetylmuramoyl-L-alanine amidase [Aquibacillus albus]MBM7570771.1 N-acetyl-anhydromuramyl-L-alanine amidase AmpD [Aquibacillus albus]
MYLKRDLITGNNRPGDKLELKTITIHETANPNEGAGAQMHRDYAQNTTNSVSYHWVVDDKIAIQVVPDEEVAWHAGTDEGNKTSLGIEICENRDADPVARYDNAVWLAAYLLHKHKLSINDLIPHKDWYGKNCPRNLLAVWQDFKRDVAAKLASMQQNKTHIKGKSEISAEQMRAYLKKRNPDAPDYVDLYFQMEEKEGVRADVAFAQSILETNAWKFGGVVSEKQNNFAGLGATGPDNPGLSFNTPLEGIMAQGRHLRLYAEYNPNLNDKKVDPRGLPNHLLGWAPFVEDLTGKWAVDIMYGYKIKRMIYEMKMTEPLEHWTIPQIEKLKERGIIKKTHDPEEVVKFGVLATVLNNLMDQMKK